MLNSTYGPGGSGTEEGLLYSFRHPRRSQNKGTVPILTTLYKDGMIIGFSDGSIRIYEDEYDNGSGTPDEYGTSILSKIGYFRPSHVKQHLQPLITVLEVTDLKTSDGNCEVLFVGYADGNLCQYVLPSGKLLAHNKLPFMCRGIDCSFSYDLVLVWGYSCQMFLLDKKSLSISLEWNELPDWPMPIPLFDNHILLIYKSGASSRWKVAKAHDSNRIKLEHIENYTPEDLSLFSPPTKSSVSNAGHFHNVDLITNVKRVGPISWLVVQRSGWSLYRWEEESLVKQISSDANKVLTKVISNPRRNSEDEHDECFGIMSNDGTITWVRNSNVQIIEPTWNNPGGGQIVSVVYDSIRKQLICTLTTSEGISMKRADTLVPAGAMIKWEEDSFLVESYQSGPSYISAVHDENVVIGHGNTITEYTLPQFLTQFEAIPPTFVLEDEEEIFTVIESSTSTKKNTTYLVAGTSHGRILALGKEKGGILNSVSAFATATTQILRMPGVGVLGSSSSFSGNVVAVSINSTVCVLDLFSGVKNCIIPGNNIAVRSISVFKLLSVATTTKEDSIGLEIEYESGEKRTWNITSGDELSLREASDISSASKRKLCPLDENCALAGEDEGILKPLNTPGNSPHQVFEPFVLVRMGNLIDNILGPYLDGGKALDDDDAGDKVELIKALITSLITIDKTLVPQQWHEQLTIPVVKGTTKPRVGHVSVNSSFVTISSLDTDLEHHRNHQHHKQLSVSDSTTNACIVTVWVILVQLLLTSVNKYEKTESYKLLGWLLEIIGFPSSNSETNTNLSGFAILGATSSSSYIRQYARICLKELLNNTDYGEDEVSVVGHWRPHLPAVTMGNIFGPESLQAVEILSSMCISRQKKRSLSSNLVREVAESLQLYLTSEAPEENRDAAIEIIGRGWLLWQQQFNPLNVLDALIAILYQNGYTTLTQKDNSNSQKQKHHRNTHLLALCQKCIQNIASQNITLLISALVTHLGSSEQPLDARITSIRLLSALISSSPNSNQQQQQPRYIGSEHLPTIISTVVKTLDPSDQNLRELSPIGGTSLMSESTQFLSTAMNKYPNSLAFHKGQQRLAVSTCDPQNTKKKPSVLLGLVYDLRTGTVIASLASQEHQTYPSGTILTNLTFSPNGKAIAAIIKTPDKISKLLSWKIGFGLMTLFQSFTTANDGNNSSTNNGDIGSITPKTTEITNDQTYEVSVFIHPDGLYINGTNKNIVD